MRVLYAVLVDLFDFAQKAFFGYVPEKIEVHSALPAHGGGQLALPSFQRVGDILARHTNVQATDEHGAPGTYFLAERSMLFCEPVVGFDTALTTLPYGAEVTLEKKGGRWAHVVDASGQSGWVVKDVLTREKEHVYPALEIDTVYGPEHETTIHIRSLLEDAFLGGVMLLPLTDVEYVSYKLREYGATILWGTARPRIAGTWQRLLRGQKGIHMSVTPKPGTAMEYLHEDTGKICFVERVLDNEVLEVSAVGLYVEGQYTYETLQKEAWRELRPVFIEVIGHA